MRLILLGAPGAGKGTQAQKLVKQLNIPQISTGDIFRKNISMGTELGLKVKDILASGSLVPDDITVAIVADRLKQSDCINGYILDGFPRSIAQAVALDALVDIDYAVNIDVDNKVILERLTGRRFCPECNGTFHVSTLQDDICPNCNGRLVIRNDDNEATVANRLDAYIANTAPLIQYYRNANKLVNVDGIGSVDEIFQRVIVGISK